MSGVLIILFVLVIGALNTFILTGSAETVGLSSGCSTSNNVTTCEQQGKETFFDNLFSATFTPFPEPTPIIINVIWALIMVTLLTTGVLLIVSSFIPFTSS